MRGGRFYIAFPRDRSPLFHSAQEVMTLAELYEALGKVENGVGMASTIKAEISRLNG